MDWQDKGYLDLSGNKKKDKNGNFLTGLIPTAGGIGGSLGGAALGASIGSVVPGVGTAIGGLLGAVLGGAGGSALGKVGENAVEGNQNLGEGVLGEALLGGITSTPLTAGLKVAKAGVKAATGIGNTAARDLLEQAGAQSVGKGTAARFDLGANTPSVATDSLGNVINPSAASRVGQAMENYGTERALANQVNLTRADVRRIGNFDPIDTLNGFGKTYGTTNLDEINRLGRFATGAGGKEDGSAILTNIIENTARSGKGVPIDGLNDVIAPYKSLMTVNDAKKLDDYIKKVTDLSGFADTATGMKSANLADPMGALKTARELQKNGAFLKNAANPSPSNEALGNAYQALGREIKDRTYNAQAGLDTGIAGLTQDAQAALNDGVASLRAEAQKYIKGGNADFGNRLNTLADQIGSAKSLQQLDEIATPFVQASQMSQLTNRAAGGAGVKLGGLKETATGAINSALGVPMAAIDQKLSSGVADLGRKVAGVGATKAAGQGIVPLATREGVGRALLNPNIATDTQPDQSTLAGALAAAGSVSQPANNAQSQMKTTPSNPTGYSSAQLGNALAQAYAAGDKPAANALEQLYQLAASYEKAQQPNLSSTAQKSLTSAANADVALQQLEQSLNQAGGGSGALGGALQNALSGVGLSGDVKLYNDQLQGYVPVILQALGKTDAPSETELKGIIQALPQVTDTKEQAAAKLASLRSRIAAAQQNTLAFNAYGSN